jgi:hypothetical protein
MGGLVSGLQALREYFDRSRDNFDRDISNPLLDLIDVAGEKQFTPEGQGTSTAASESSALGNRELYPGDIGLIWVDSNTSGIHEVDILASQNS